MKDELQNKLYDKYPELFENRHKSPRESCMAWGIECGDGWYDILSALCFGIAQHERNKAAELKREGQNGDYQPFKFDQIKEKFGGLRIYHDGGDEFVRGMIYMADSLSYMICEACGARGKANEKGWISVLCDDCRNKNKTA